MTTTGRELTSQEVLADWLEEDIDHEAAERLAAEAIQRLTDAGFAIVDAQDWAKWRQG